MRVLYDHQVFSLQDAGGASRYFYELMKFMTGVPEVETKFLLGISATVYPFRQLHSPKTDVRSLPGWLPPGTSRYIANEMWSNVTAPLLGSVDVYHPTAYLRMPMVRARKVIATHHDCTYERFPELFPNARKALWARKWLFPRVDAIICVSESCRQDLLRFYNVDRAKTCVIHHGLSMLPRSPEAAVTLQRHLRRDYLLYVGMRAAFKNFDGLLQAFHDSGIAEWLDLLVLGGGPFAAREKTRIADLGLDGHVIGLPSVSDELLAEAYARARLLVYPSLNEGFGFPPLEAMSLGCPVLASSIPAIREVCREAPFYFDPMDQGSFDRQLLRAVNDEGARQQAVEKGSKVAAGYEWNKCAEKTLALYKSC